MPLYTVHFHETALKGANRPLFERHPRDNIRRTLGEGTKVKSFLRRILVDTPVEEVAQVANVCGIAYALRIQRLPLNLAAAGQAVIDQFARSRPGHFRISARRVDKAYPLTSPEIDKEVGAIVHEATGVPVRLRNAERDIQLTVTQEEILLGVERAEGPGGLPVGASGRVAVLMSGGIDSPVAAWRMMNRGCRCDLIHFHSHPLVDRTTQEKARDLAETLNRWQLTTRLHLVPLAPIQTEIRLNCPENLRVILYRRFMLRIAERIARRRKCGALITGESLGQVASQTLHNLGTVSAVATLLVLRPLIGLDKQEIIRTAERLGTFPISIQPDQDCCQLFVPPRPATKSTDAQATEAEAALDVEALVAAAVENTEVVKLGTN